MILIDGNKLSKKILNNVKQEIQKKQLKLKLAVVLVGNTAVSKSYINKKKEACEFAGIDFELLNFPEEISEEDLKKEVVKLAEDNNVSGIVIQLPLPQNFNSQKILDLIPAEKDIDVLSETSFEKFSKKELPIFPPVVGAVKNLLEEYNVNIENKRIAVIGKGKLVGKPLAAWLKNIKADFSVIDRTVENISEITKKADVIISGAGSLGLIKKDMIKDGAVLIDAGASSEEGEIKGDIDKDCYEKASFVAPVPGGVGPVTIACLIDNLLNICYHYRQEE